MRLLAIAAVAMLAGCGGDPNPAEQAKKDLTTEIWYAPTTERLAAVARQAEELLKNGKREEAAAAISSGQPLLKRLLYASRPTLAAMEAVSDLDQLYAEMLLRNKYYGEARMLFQKNAIRWKTWRPQTADTERRLKIAQAGIAECDRRLTE